MDQNSLTIVVPAYNEGKALPETLPAMLEFVKERHWKLIVVNDGSRDDTREILAGFEQNPRLKVIHHKVNRGYGGALKSGLAAVETDFAVTFDADGQHQLNDIPRLLAVMMEQDADMIVGSRQRTKQSHWYRELGKWIIRRIAATLMPMHLKDLNSGFKLYRTSIMKSYLSICPNSMAFSDVITLIFLNQKHKVLEEPIQVLPRKSGDSTINTATAFDTVLEIINLVMLFNPLRVFLPASIIFILIGLVWGVPIIFMGRGVSVGSMLAIVTGVIFFVLGLIAEQLSQIRKNIK